MKQLMQLSDLPKRELMALGHAISGAGRACQQWPRVFEAWSPLVDSVSAECARRLGGGADESAAVPELDLGGLSATEVAAFLRASERVAVALGERYPMAAAFWQMHVAAIAASEHAERQARSKREARHVVN